MNKYRSFIIAFIVGIIIFSCVQSSNHQKTDKFLIEDETEMKGKIDELIKRYFELNRFSGSVLIDYNNNIFYNRSFGYSDYKNKRPFSDNTTFKVGKLTEILSENILRKLLQQSGISPDSLVKANFPQVEYQKTYRTLFQDDLEGKERFLGRLIENMSQRDFVQNMDDYCNDLSLDNTYLYRKDSSLAKGYLFSDFQGNGLELHESPTMNLDSMLVYSGLKSTTHDLLKIVQSNPRKIEIDGNIEDDGFSYSLVHNLDRKLTIIILSNRRHPVCDEISHSILSILSDKTYDLPLARNHYSIDMTTLQDYEGVYELNEYVKFKVIQDGEDLFVLMGPNQIPLIPQSSNQFYLPNQDAAMRFLRDSMNAVDRVKLLNGFIDSKDVARKIK